MSTDFLTAKIARGFDHLDVDGDGLLTESDHVLMGQRAAAALGHQAGSAAERALVEAYLRIWTDQHLPHLPAGSSAVSRADFVASTRTLADDPVAAQATIGALAQTFLSIADTNADGRVSRAEFGYFQRGHFPGIGDAELTEAFSHLDADGDGYLASEEFITAIIEYWTSSDPSAPGNWWTGRPPSTT
jgi:Ca2+-binding EF-hand superfamily protein